MSLRRLSPTANLLRTSRLFSLPPPLPRPAPDVSAISNFDSDTATTPYPTHAAIETTQQSLARGDWGLKRALPLKSTTRTSTPVINIDNIDSIDHITDFGSAADHALNLRKWQELDMPLLAQEKRRNVSRPLSSERSVFDSRYDNTHVDVGETSGGPAKQRWKFKGPWLAGKTNGEFNHYLEKNVKRRKLDFKRFVGDHLLRAKAAARNRQAVEQDEDLESLRLEEITVSEEEVEKYLRHLRTNEMELHKLIEKYLDLPREEGRQLGGSPSHYDEKGPPTTHPSAGLSYLRTNSHIYNHPELGPQENKAPIQGRVIVPQRTGDRNNVQALIGVAGVVGKDSKKVFHKEESDQYGQGVGYFEPDIPGGGKLWTDPKWASIDSHGRIDLVLDRAVKNAVNVKWGVHSEEPKPPPAAVAAAYDRDVPDLIQGRRRSSSASQGYGLENLNGGTGSGRATPFFAPDDRSPEDAFQQLLNTGSLPSRK